jgi:Tfp pilus assembly protein PilX
MKSQQAGIVMITTILFIAVLSLLVLSQMQLVFFRLQSPQSIDRTT